MGLRSLAEGQAAIAASGQTQMAALRKDLTYIFKMFEERMARQSEEAEARHKELIELLQKSR